MFQLFGQQLSILELTGTVFGIAGVWFTIKKNTLCFPVGIVNVTLYSWLFYQAKLYADSILQVFYILLLLYGWYEWTIGKKLTVKKAVTTTSLKSSITLFIAATLATIGIGTFLKYNTDASLPYVDSLTTSMSLVAQWLVAKKKIENWLLWIAADVIYVGMYMNKQLYLTSFLYSIFIVLAMIGWQQWKKDLQVKVTS